MVTNNQTYTNITTNTTTLVKAGTGFLHSITINTAGASANVATIYNSLTATGSKIATLDTVGKGFYQYDVAFDKGLTIVTGTGTASDMTVSYS